MELSTRYPWQLSIHIEKEKLRRFARFGATPRMSVLQGISVARSQARGRNLARVRGLARARSLANARSLTKQKAPPPTPDGRVGRSSWDVGIPSLLESRKLLWNLDFFAVYRLGGFFATSLVTISRSWYVPASWQDTNRLVYTPPVQVDPGTCRTVSNFFFAYPRGGLFF